MKVGRKPYSTDPQEKLVRCTFWLPLSMKKRIKHAVAQAKKRKSESEVMREWLVRVIK